MNVFYGRCNNSNLLITLYLQLGFDSSVSTLFIENTFSPDEYFSKPTTYYKTFTFIKETFY